MAEYKTKLQNNISWTETFRMGRKAPAVANRIFSTLADAQQYVDDITDSATEGIRISVIADTTIENNGLYYVKAIKDDEHDKGVLVQLGRGTAAWYKGNAVDEDGSKYEVSGASVGDIYMNSETLDTYVLQPDGSWKKVGNIAIFKVDKTVPYYKLSIDGTVHPEFPQTGEGWIEGDDTGSNIPTNYEEIGKAAGKNYHGQVYLWTRFFVDGEDKPKYTVALAYSTLNLGEFTL